MRQILIVSLLTVAFAGLSRGQGTAGNRADAKIEKEILKVERERDEAVQKRDMAVLDRIYADDYVVANARGHVLTKAQRLADYRSGNTRFLSFKQDDYRLHFYGDTVVMTGRSSGVVEHNGKIIRVPRRFTSVYIKQGGQWRLVGQSETVITNH